MRRKSSIVQTPSMQFIYFCMQRGTITTCQQFLELLARIGEKSFTVHDLRMFPQVWTEGTPLSKNDFLKMLSELLALQASNTRYMTEEGAKNIFYALTNGAEVLPTLLLKRVFGAAGIHEAVVDGAAEEYFSLGSFWSLVSGDGNLSHHLLQATPKLLDGVELANAEGFQPSPSFSTREALQKGSGMGGKGGGRSASDDDAHHAGLPVEEYIAAVLWEARAELTAFAEKSRRLTAQLRQQQHLHRHRQKTAYFAPHVVTDMLADVDGEIPLLQMTHASSAGTDGGVGGAIRDPMVVLSEVDRSMTSQVVVSRVADLRKHRVAQEERHEARQRAKIQTAVYDAFLLATDASGTGSGASSPLNASTGPTSQFGSPTTSMAPGGGRGGASFSPAVTLAQGAAPAASFLCVDDLQFLEGIGEAASRRLFPHHKTPQDAIQEQLARRLGLAFLPPGPALPATTTTTAGLSSILSAVSTEGAGGQHGAHQPSAYTFCGSSTATSAASSHCGSDDAPDAEDEQALQALLALDRAKAAERKKQRRLAEKEAERQEQQQQQSAQYNAETPLDLHHHPCREGTANPSSSSSSVAQGDGGVKRALSRGTAATSTNRRAPSAVHTAGAASAQRHAEQARRNDIKGFFFSNAPRAIISNFSSGSSSSPPMAKYTPPPPRAVDLLYQSLSQPAASGCSPLGASVTYHLRRASTAASLLATACGDGRPGAAGKATAAAAAVSGVDRKGHNQGSQRPPSASGTLPPARKGVHDASSGVSSSTASVAPSALSNTPAGRSFTKSDLLHQSQILLCDARDALERL